MILLALRTDRPEAYIGLYDDDKKLGDVQWQAHRQLAETLHTQIDQLLKLHDKGWADIQGIACYQGPGSFTGLRIGLSVANALAASLPAAIVGVVSDGNDDDQWLPQALAQLRQGVDQKIVLPEYGAPVHITQQRK